MDDFQLANYRRFKFIFKPIFDMMIDTSIRNPQRVPEEGPCVLVANHRSDLDPWLIMVNVKRPIHWIGASYLWNIPLFRDFLRGIGAIPVSKYRSEIDSAFNKAQKLLEQGECVGIFPEGWDYIADNQFDWSVGQFQTGFARIAVRTGSPVVPCAMLGLLELRAPNPFPPFMRKILDFPLEMQYIRDRCVYRKLHINVGHPLHPPADADPNDREAVKAFTQQVNDKVIELYNAIPRDIAGFEDLEPSPAGPPPPPEPKQDPTAFTAASDAPMDESEAIDPPEN
jgi:1-acyl-sn-glycerol-3-phosphate acyltransferase